MPTFRKFKVKWGKSYISTHATRRPACPPHSVCGGQSGWPGSTVDRGSAGEPSGAHSLWQGAEICPPDPFALSPGTWETPYQPPRQQGVAVCPGALPDWPRKPSPVLVPLWGRVKLVGPQEEAGPLQSLWELVHLPLRHWLWISHEQN